jgi:uroporphyrinogen-III synthase
VRAEARAIYDQESVPPGPELAAALAHEGPILAPLFSPRSAKLFARAVGDAPVTPVAMSPAVRAALPEGLAARAVTAERPDAPAMLRALAALISP